MQTVIRAEKNIHPIFDEFDRLYAEFSEKEQKNASSLISVVCDEAFTPLIQLFKDYGWQGELKTANKAQNSLKTPPNRKKDIIVCFSGGKDSTALVERYLERNFNVYLYHLRGINKTYTDEYKAVERIAEHFNLPLFIDRVKLSGVHDYIEHPMKNMIIANGALQYAIREGIGTNIAFGNFSTSSLSSDPFEVCGGDCVEMWDIYNAIISRFIAGFHIQTPSSNFQDTIDTISSHAELLPLTISCLTPNRFRAQLRGKNQKKYKGFPKLENRCGSCWKCCLEYCVFTDKGILEYNDSFYRHCLEVLRNTLKKETGATYSIDEVWSHYFFYPQSESKFFIDAI